MDYIKTSLSRSFVLPALLLLAIHGITAGISSVSAADFVPTAQEKQVLESLRSTPIRLAYSYEVVYAKLPDGSHAGMIAPFLEMLEKQFGLKVEVRKLDWTAAFEQIQSGEVDFYGPIGLTEQRRKQYLSIDPIFRADAEIVTRVRDPLGMLVNLTNKKVGLLNGSSMQKPLVTYLQPNGLVVYYPTMDAMMQGLEQGEIICFATADNAELEIMRHPTVDNEQLVPNFFVDQGFLSKNEKLKPLIEIVNRYLQTPEGQKIIPATLEARRKELIRSEQVHFAADIAAFRKKYKSIKIFDSGSLYPMSYEENGKRQGMLAEIHGIFQELTGVPVETLDVDYFQGNHPTATELLRNGQCQLIASQYSRDEVWKSPDFAYSAPIWRDTIRAYTYGQTDTRDLQEMKVGATKNCAEFFNWNVLTGTEPEIFESRLALLSALKQRKVDVTFISEMAFNYHYSILKDYNLRAYGDISAVAFLRYLYSEKNAELNRLMDDAIKLHYTINPHARVQWMYKADQYKADVIRLSDLRRKVYLGIGVVVTALSTGIIISLYRFKKYDKQIRALIQRQQTFDLAWGDLKKRWFISKGDHPFFRQWGLNFSGPSCSMDELADAFGWNLYDDYVEDMKKMKEQALDFIITDKKVVSHTDGKEHYYRRYLHRLSDSRFMSCLQDITDQHEAEIQEQFLNELFGAMRDGLVFFDRDMRILKHNEEMPSIIPIRYPSEDICYKAVHGRDDPCERCPVVQTFKDGKRHREDFYYDHLARWVEISSYPINDPKTVEVVRVLEFARDITEQRNWENTLQEREKYLAAILEASNDGIIAVSELDGKSHVNNRFIEMFDGGDPEIFRQNTTLETLLGLHKKVSRQWKEVNDARILATKTLQPQSGTLELYDGRIYEWRVVPTEFGFEGRTGVTRIWTYRDVTERFRAAEAIQKSEIKFRTLFNASPSGLALFDAVYGPDGKPVDFRYVGLNPAMEKINRMTKEQLVGRTLSEYFENIRIDSGKLDGESILKSCLLAMDGEPGVYTTRFDQYNAYHQITVFKTESGQLAIFVTDDTTRVLDERALRTMHNVIEHISEPVIWLDQEGTIRYINEAGSKAFGFQLSEPPLYRKIWDFDVNLSMEKWPALYERIDTEETVRFETTLQRRDDTVFPAHVVIDRMEQDGHKLLAACFRDMSEQIRRIEAEQTARAKSRFLDHMSHEIRTPLNGMIGMTTLLSETDLTSKQQGYVDLARSSGKQLLSIVNGILDFSDINAGKVILHPARFDFSGLVFSVIAQATEKLDEKDTEGNIEFRVQYATVVPRYLVGDMERLEQIILALLDNAIKFTEQGSITLIVSDEGHESRDVGTPCILRVEILDTGVGISEEKMKHLYESFALGDASFSRKYGGTGLGLYISKSLVELMGGAVYDESKVETGKGDGGSRFWFIVPLPIDGTAYLEAKQWTVTRKITPRPFDSLPPLTPAVIEKDESAESSNGPLILLVEDNKINRIVEGEILKNAGFRYEFAENGQIACDMVAAKEFSLILMDCQMPVMDGFEATQTIRNMEAGTDTRKPGHSGRIPIIALTANAMKGDKEACLAAGMDAFCGKPVEAPHLLASIRNWLR